jgi:hypothetical protein
MAATKTPEEQFEVHDSWRASNRLREKLNSVSCSISEMARNTDLTDAEREFLLGMWDLSVRLDNTITKRLTSEFKKKRA